VAALATTGRGTLGACIIVAGGLSVLASHDCLCGAAPAKAQWHRLFLRLGLAIHNCILPRVNQGRQVLAVGPGVEVCKFSALQYYWDTGADITATSCYVSRGPSPSCMMSADSLDGP